MNCELATGNCEQLTETESSTRRAAADQRRFYTIALGSLRECEAIITLANLGDSLLKQADQLAAHLYKLIQSRVG